MMIVLRTLRCHFVLIVCQSVTSYNDEAPPVESRLNQGPQLRTVFLFCSSLSQLTILLFFFSEAVPADLFLS